MGQEPHHRVLKLLGNMKQMPDELYMILRRDFRRYGALIENVRKFETPSFRPNAVGKDKGFGVNNPSKKRFNPKKTIKKMLPYSSRKNMVH